MKTKPALGFIGAGRTATALATALAAKGYRIPAVASRSLGSAQQLAARLGGSTRARQTAQEAADACQVLFITTPDDAIAATAAGITWRQAQSVVHCSGALSVDVLAPVVKAGGHAGCLHPLQSLAVERQQPFAGATFGLEGEGALLGLLQQMAEDMGGRWVVVPAGGKAAYHAGAVLASNYVVTLLAKGSELLAGLGIPSAQALEAILGLLRGTVRNLEDVGLPHALTGPIARGDAGTVRRHLATLADSPELLEAYRALGRLTVPIGRAKGTLSGEAAQELEHALGKS